MEKPELRKITEDPNLPGLEKLVRLFFAPSKSSQAAGQAFAARLAERKEDREPLAGMNVAMAQIAAFRAWEHFSGDRFANLLKITQPCLVANGVFDNMIPVRNSYMLSEHLPNALLSGNLRFDCLDQVMAEINLGETVALDLNEVNLVDVEAVRFLNAREDEGMPSRFIPHDLSLFTKSPKWF
jgi:hypothetical protein